MSGKNVKRVFNQEAGGHRWQRVPPTEKKGRVQTSTITVSVLREPTRTEVKINEKDLDWKYTRGSGAGGQNRNKNDTAVVLTHKPSGLRVRSENNKSQVQNKETAFRILRAKLLEEKRGKAKASREKTRKAQVGSGMRGDKVRTIQVRNNKVIDHVTGKTTTYKKYSKGILEDLQ